MRKIIFLLAILTFSINVEATVITCNNNNPSPGQYATLQSAVDAASAGDTIYVSGSYFTYGSANVNKRLTIIGTGHNPQKQVPLKSEIAGISLTSANAKNTRIIGLVLDAIYASTNNVDSIYIERNEIRYYVHVSSYSNCDYWFIQGNLFSYTAQCIYCANNTHSWFIIRNNIFNGYMHDLNYNANSSFYLINNLFLGTSAFSASNNGIFVYNNIFYRASPSPNTGGCVWQNNLSYQCSNNNFPSGTGNQTNVNPLFVNFPNAGALHSYTYDFTLQGSSPALNAGNDGKNLGLTGGDFYYEKNGIPSIPQIRSFNITSNPNIAPGGTLQINVKSTIKK